jgi:hypothetical protein
MESMHMMTAKVAPKKKTYPMIRVKDELTTPEEL